VVVLHNVFQCFHETKEAVNAWSKQSKFIAASAPVVVDKGVKLSSFDSKFGREVVREREEGGGKEGERDRETQRQRQRQD